MATKNDQMTFVFNSPPKMVHNDQGETVEVILSYDDYKSFLRFLADYVDWESLPSTLQDEVDHLLAEEAREEQGDEPYSQLSDVFAELDIRPEDAKPEEGFSN
jgi:hypothetical protein